MNTLAWAVGVGAALVAACPQPEPQKREVPWVWFLTALVAVGAGGWVWRWGFAAPDLQIGQDLHEVGQASALAAVFPAVIGIVTLVQSFGGDDQ